MRLLIYILAAIVLTGCATTSGYEKKLTSLNSVTEVDLIRMMGTPQQIYQAGESKFITYSSSRFVMIPTASGSMGNTKSCQTTFEINQGIVVGSAFKGNDCKA